MPYTGWNTQTKQNQWFQQNQLLNKNSKNFFKEKENNIVPRLQNFGGFICPKLVKLQIPQSMAQTIL